MGFISRYIMPLVINSLGHGHTHTHTSKHINDLLRINFKKPGAHRHVLGLINVISEQMKIISFLTKKEAMSCSTLLEQPDTSTTVSQTYRGHTFSAKLNSIMIMYIH